jgi:Zn-dependent protease
VWIADGTVPIHGSVELLTPDQLANGVVYYVVFLFSTTVHEAAHAWAAKLGGDLTAYHGGQVSLDPRPHIEREPIGMVILPIISTLLTGWPLGFASAPYDPAWALRYPRRAGWMAVAGPASNLLIALVAVAVIHAGVAAGIFYAPDTANFHSVVASDAGRAWESVAFVVSVFFSLNLMMACLNMIPLPPLDGSAAVVLLLNGTLARRYQELLMLSNGFGMIGLFVAWEVFDVVFSPIFWMAINLIYPGITYS